MSIGTPFVDLMLNTALDGPRWLIPTDDADVEIGPRQQITYAPSTAGVKASTSTHSFELLTPATVTKFRVFDAETAGLFVWDGPMTRAVPGGVGDRIVISPGAITHSIT